MSEARGAALGTVIVMTSNARTLADFYARGLEIGPFEEAPRHLGCRVGDVYFGFDQVDGLSRDASPSVTAWFTVEDLERTFRRFVEMGARVRSEPADRPWGARIASVLDPDGNLVGLHQR